MELQHVDASKPSDFEVAIQATGFGKFNILLLLAILPSTFSQVFEVNALAYVLPVAHCDLELTLEDKGLLNAISFAGMVTSGFLWGYLCDSLGRKKIIIVGYFLTGFFSLLTSTSQNFTMLITAKFFSGFVINGPFSATISYLSEFHSTQYRARIQLIRGVQLTLALMILPLLAWATLQHKLNISFHGYFVIHTWNIFLFISALIPIIAGAIFVFMPESPKFLMSIGKNDEALRVFQKVYKINTGLEIGTYPIKYLVDENVRHKIAISEKNLKKPIGQTIKTVFLQIKPLFCPPNVLKLVLLCTNSFLLMSSVNGLQLWLPQLFQSMSDYEIEHSHSNPSVCETIQELTQSKNSTGTSCVVNLDNSSVYINSTYLGIAQVLGLVVAGMFINRLGKKKLMFIVASVTSCSAISLYFAQSSTFLLVSSAMFLSFGNVGGIVLVTISLELFPTTLRAMALSMNSMSGRIGTIFGSLIFPFLLRTGCATPFMLTGAFVLGCAFFTFLYPNTDNKALRVQTSSSEEGRAILGTLTTSGEFFDRHRTINE